MAFARINYFSRSLLKASSVSVVFPDDPAMPRPFWVYYLLHGLSDDDTIWMRRTSIERYVEGLPLMVVMPDGGRGWYTNAVVGAAHENDLVKDVVGLIDRIFPVRAERSGRAIGGLSMGGYGAVKVGLKHHEMFGSINSHSGALAIAQEDWSSNEGRRDIVPELERIFGKDHKGGPEDPFALVEKMDHGRVPAIRIDCGKDDFLIEHNRSFHKHLESMHIPHEYEEFPGSHNWPYWDTHVQQAIAFHVRNLKITK